MTYVSQVHNKDQDRAANVKNLKRSFRTNFRSVDVPVLKSDDFKGGLHPICGAFKNKAYA